MCGDGGGKGEGEAGKGKGCGSAAAKAHGADNDAECRNKDLLRAAVPQATTLAAGDGGFA